MIIHKKHDDWRARLDVWVAKSTAMPFAWGVHDCALNAATAVCVQVEDGTDFSAGFRGKYATLEDGFKLLRKAGFSNHADLAASLLPEIPSSFAQIGDIAAVKLDNDGIALMVVAGHRLIGPMPDMAGSLPLTRAFRAFAVGRQP